MQESISSLYPLSSHCGQRDSRQIKEIMTLGGLQIALMKFDAKILNNTVVPSKHCEGVRLSETLSPDNQPRALRSYL